MTRALFWFGILASLLGYLMPWINHTGAAGLVITGLDLGELVKFLPEVRDGTISLWRPGFYAPPVAVAAATILALYRSDWLGPRVLRIPALVVTIVAIGLLLPPAWTPARLLEAEFRVQSTSMLLLGAGLALSPFLARIPANVARTVITLLAAAAIALPVYGLLQILPAVRDLYQRPLVPAWGVWLMVFGLLAMLIAAWRLPHPALSQT